MGYSALQRRLEQGRIVFLDGGTGTELEKRGVAMDSEAWCGPAALENADILEDIHLDYIHAGADVITANTYASSRLMLEGAGYSEQFEQINRNAVASALRARERSGRDDVLIAGSLSHMCPLKADTDRTDEDRQPPPEAMRAAFRELAMLLRDAGCDLILLEMMYDPPRMELAFEAAEATRLPLWAGFAVRRDSRGEILGFSSEKPAAFTKILEILRTRPVQAAGLMHSSANVIEDGLAILRARYDGPLMAYPDSGYFRMPHWQFEDVIEPEDLVDFARSWIDGGVQIIGGCCGLSPAHISALRDAFR